ncbi:MDR family MFS transporter [Maritalea myrionectae]|uniref:MDR family MFS transporter n=1 Tax=Maritalea myrionectae TaxID=454601 RepID=UPI00146C8385|nr:MFS transporter [Maritalea myrionectae]
MIIKPNHVPPESLQMFAALKEFNKTIWLLILATFASRFFLFMVWPFLAIMLHNKFGLNEFEIGAFLTGSATVGVIFGFYVGYLSDIIGRRKIILVGLFLNILAMAVIGIAESLLVLFLGTLLQSFGRGTVENPGKALMTDMVSDRKVKDMALHVRYFMLNVGAATGPLLGTFVGATGQQSTFLWISGLYMVYFTAAAVIFNIEKPLKRTMQGDPLKFSTALSVLRKDTPFLLFVFASFIGFVGYGQIESGLVQYLRQMSVPELTELYATLILINGGTVILFQFALLKLMENWSPFLRAMSGVIFFAGGFFGFAIAPTDPWVWIMVAMGVLSIGEAILFPTLNIITDRLAPEHLKGSYFGASSLSSFGFVFAPLFGGFLLHQFGGMALWLTMTALTLFVAVLYFSANRLKGGMLES